MIFTGTAAELAELTRKWWAAEWWPSGLVYETDFEPVWVAEEGTVSPKDASSIIFAAAMTQMDGLHFRWESYATNPPAGPCRLIRHVYDDVDERLGEGPSMLHAVLAALEVVG